MNSTLNMRVINWCSYSKLLNGAESQIMNEQLENTIEALEIRIYKWIKRVYHGLKTIKCTGHGKAENTIYMADIRRKKGQMQYVGWITKLGTRGNIKEAEREVVTTHVVCYWRHFFITCICVPFCIVFMCVLYGKCEVGYCFCYYCLVLSQMLFWFMVMLML